MDNEQEVLGEVRDPDGRAVVLLERIWVSKIVPRRPELTGLRHEVLETVANPDHVETDVGATACTGPGATA